MWSKADKTSPGLLVFLRVPELLTLFKVLLLEGERGGSVITVEGGAPLLLLRSVLVLCPIEERGSRMDIVAEDRVKPGPVPVTLGRRTELDFGLRMEA